MKTKITILSLFIFGILGLQSNLKAQCTDYIGGEINSFGSAPVVLAGCPQYNEISDFEVFAAEAYIIENFVLGQEYSFNVCNGPGAGTWVPEFTIQAPSGAIDAFGAGDGDGCTITWTASESGTYLIILNEMGQCGGGDNTSTDNGFPTLEIIADASNCDTTICLQWQEPSSFSGYNNFNTEFGGAPSDFGEGCDTFTVTIAVWASEGYALNNVIEGGSYEFNICEGTGAGSWIPEFTIISPSGNVDASGSNIDSCSISWTASESGSYLIVVNELGQCGGGSNTATNNGFPSITCTGGAVAECSAGSIVSEKELLVCGDLDSFMIEVENSIFPDQGGIGYGFAPGNDGTGGNETGFAITNSSPNVLFNSDINGILSSNNLPVLRGTWMVSPFTYTDSENAVASRCDVSIESISVFFNSDVIVEAEDVGGGLAVVNATGGTAPYTFLWSDGESQMSDTLDVAEDGEYSVTVTDALGCISETSVMIMSTSVEELLEIENILVAPNPTKGELNVIVTYQENKITNLRILDLAGRIIESQSYNHSGQVASFDLGQCENGMYLLQINVDGKSLYKKVIVNH